MYSLVQALGLDDGKQRVSQGYGQRYRLCVYIAAGLPSGAGIRSRLVGFLFTSAIVDNASGVSGTTNRHCANWTSPCVDLVGVCEERVVDATPSFTIVAPLRLTPRETDDPIRKAGHPLEDTPQMHPPTTFQPTLGDKPMHPPRTLSLLLGFSWRHRRHVLHPRLHIDSLLKTSRQSNVETNGSKLWYVCACL